jgi:hypothetical protein
MKKTIMLLAAIIMIAGLSNKLMAQATDAATATATIVTPIAIAMTANMNFGNVAVTGTGGTVILAPASTRTISGGVTLPVVPGTVAAASFNVTGEGTYTYDITLPSADYTITNTTGVGGETMIVNTFTSTPSGTGQLTAGAQTLNVGATLNVSAGQVAGVYTNATGFDVTVNYN